MVLRPGACGSNSVFDVRFTRSRARVTRAGDPALRDEGRVRGFSCSRGVSSSRPGTTDTQCGCVRAAEGRPEGAPGRTCRRRPRHADRGHRGHRRLRGGPTRSRCRVKGTEAWNPPSPAPCHSRRRRGVPAAHRRVRPPHANDLAQRKTWKGTSCFYEKRQLFPLASPAGSRRRAGTGPPTAAVPIPARPPEGGGMQANAEYPSNMTLSIQMLLKQSVSN